MNLTNAITPQMAVEMLRRWEADSCTRWCRSAHHFAQEMIQLYPQLKPFAEADDSTKYGDYIGFADSLLDAALDRKP